MPDELRPRYPLYIPAKGRAEYMMTSRALSEVGVRHYVVVESQELEAYRRASSGLLAEVLELDHGYKHKYETCDSLGLSKSTGPGPARNFAWDHARALGAPWHWVMDDNIKGFFRLNRNLKTPCKSPAYWRAMEDFVLRYENVGMAGPNYFMFASRKTKMPPVSFNTRIYSCNLIRNDLPYRWRGRYNEDTILSLDLLRGGWATVQFNAFLQYKMPTQTIGGGNTKEFYHAEGERAAGEKYAAGGTSAKSKMLADVYPQYARVVWRFGRVHHHVDYSSFRSLKLRRRSDIAVTTGVNDYGMTLIQVGASRRRPQAVKACAPEERGSKSSIAMAEVSA